MTFKLDWAGPIVVSVCNIVNSIKVKSQTIKNQTTMMMLVVNFKDKIH